MRTNVVGVNHCNDDGTNRASIISSMSKSDKLCFELDPYNKYDSNAVKVCVIKNREKKQIGFLSKNIAPDVSSELRKGHKYIISIVDVGCWSNLPYCSIDFEKVPIDQFISKLSKGTSISEIISDFLKNRQIGNHNQTSKVTVEPGNSDISISSSSNAQVDLNQILDDDFKADMKEQNSNTMSTSKHSRIEDFNRKFGKYLHHGQNNQNSQDRRNANDVDIDNQVKKKDNSNTIRIEEPTSKQPETIQTTNIIESEIVSKLVGAPQTVELTIIDHMNYLGIGSLICGVGLEIIHGNVRFGIYENSHLINDLTNLTTDLCNLVYRFYYTFSKVTTNKKVAYEGKEFVFYGIKSDVGLPCIGIHFMNKGNAFIGCSMDMNFVTGYFCQISRTGEVSYGHYSNGILIKEITELEYKTINYSNDSVYVKIYDM